MPMFSPAAVEEAGAVVSVQGCSATSLGELLLGGKTIFKRKRREELVSHQNQMLTNISHLSQLLFLNRCYGKYPQA